MTDTTPRRLEEYEIAGLQVMLQRVFGVTAKVSTRDDGYEVFAREQDNQLIDFPFAFLTLEGTDENTEEFNTDRVANIGLRHETFDDEGKSTGIEIVSTVPIKLTFGFHYFTDDFDQLLDFISRWHMARKKNKLDFALSYREVPHSVKIELQRELTVPKKETPATNSNVFEFDGEFIMHGHLTSSAAEDIVQAPRIETIELSIFMIDDIEDKSTAILEDVIIVPDETDED
mgnify:CR=1 FL=1